MPLRERFASTAFMPLAASLAFAACVAFAVGFPAELHRTCREDGPIESFTAVAFLASAIAFAAAATRRDDSALGRAHRLWLWAAAVGAFLCFGEEISWGQRLLGIETPRPFLELNAQRELNVHNLQGVQPLKYTVLVAGISLALIGAFAVRTLAPARALARTLKVPVPALADLSWLVASIFLLRNLANCLAMAERNDAQELGELFLALGVCAFAVRARLVPASIVVAAETLMPAADSCRSTVR